MSTPFAPVLGGSSGLATDGMLSDDSDAPAAVLADRNTRRLGTDVALPLDPGDEMALTGTGDLETVTGNANLQAAVRRRTVISPGALVHRPEYGAGLAQRVEQLNTPSARSLLANAIKRNTMRDPRVADCSVAVAVGRPSDTRPEAITVELSVRARGDETSQGFTVSAE